MSGGSSGASVPSATDNAIFDANSGGGAVEVADNGGGNPPECANLTCTGFTGSIDSTGYGLNINGDVTLSTDGTYTGLYLLVVSGTCTLTSVGKSVYEINIEPGATVTLADDAVMVGNGLYVSGTFTTNNFNVVADTTFIVGTLNMGSSTFTVNGGAWYADPLSTINAGTSTILITDGAAFDGGDKNYYNLNIGANLDLTGNNTFNTISNSAAPIALRFDGGSTTTVTNFNVSGTEDNLVTLNRFNSNNRFILSKASGTVSVDYLQIQRSDATGGAAWYAGANSNNLGLNLGWIFTAPPPPVVQTVTIGAGIILGPGVSIT
jgi:hypothetical protein